MTTSQANHDLIQGLFAECWYSCIHGGIPYWNKDVGAFVRGPLESRRDNRRDPVVEVRVVSHHCEFNRSNNQRRARYHSR